MQEWISTKVQTPRHNEVVLLAVRGDFVYIVMGWCYYTPDGIKYTYLGMNGSDDLVTHWMPLPKLPGE